MIGHRLDIVSFFDVELHPPGVDLDGDERPELVVSHGNDISVRVAVKSGGYLPQTMYDVGACGYCVPLFQIRRKAAKEAASLALDFSTPVSSAGLWRHLFAHPRRGQRPVAVVFELPPPCWPVDVFLEVQSFHAERLLESLSITQGVGVSRDAADFVRRAAEWGLISDLSAVVHTPSGLGALLHRFLAVGATAWSRYDDSVEVVVRRQVPATAVCKLVALSQTNVEAKQRRARSVGRDPFDGCE